jgi:hypothetical protein
MRETGPGLGYAKQLGAQLAFSVAKDPKAEIEFTEKQSAVLNERVREVLSCVDRCLLLYPDQQEAVLPLFPYVLPKLIPS